MSYLVYITVPNESEARQLARTLVERHLAAGANVLPGANSIYRWQGRVHEAGECLVFAQISRAAFADACVAIQALHSHQVPCVIALPIEAGHEPFLRWIEANSLPSSR
ncbi:MAG: divalent-cation tolerance protein CutA [Desulfovibrionaceae bacterium]|nr:divalent-cation tolerance protein CutA [Desulfovibrionaceae bacterium]